MKQPPYGTKEFKLSIIVPLLIILLGSCDSFTVRLHHQHGKVKAREEMSRLFSEKSFRPGSLAAATAERGKVPYGEESRQYRRTIYSHDDWIAHRSNDRLVEHIKGIFFSGIVRQLQKEIALVTGIAIFLTIWNDALVPMMPNVPHLALPFLPFTLSSPALGLLLVFRTNTSYQRWMEARMRWGIIISQSRNMIRMATTFADTTTQEGRESMEHLAHVTWLISRSIMNTLSGSVDDEALERDVRKEFEGNDTFISRFLAAPDRSGVALMEASLVLNTIPVDEKRRVEIDKSLVILGDTMSSCDRIFQSPVPLVYTRHTARFLSLWMILLPFALHDEFVKAGTSGWPTIPASAGLSLFLFGIEELAVQLEEPFSILPMQSFCDEIRKSSSGLIEWAIQSQEQQKVE